MIAFTAAMDPERAPEVPASSAFISHTSRVAWHPNGYHLFGTFEHGQFDIHNPKPNTHPPDCCLAQTYTGGNAMAIVDLHNQLTNAVEKIEKLEKTISTMEERLRKAEITGEKLAQE